MNKKMGLMMAMGLLISAPLLSKDYLISTPRTSLLITANEGEKSKMQYYGVSITPVQIQNIYDAGLAFEADSSSIRSSDRRRKGGRNYPCRRQYVIGFGSR